MITTQELVDEHKRLCFEYYQTWRDTIPFSATDDEKLYVYVGKILQSEFYLRLNGIDGVKLTEEFYKEKGELNYGCYDEVRKYRP